MSAYYALSHTDGDFNDPDPAPELQIPSCHVGRPLFRPWLAPRFRRWFQSAQFVHSTTQLLPGCCWRWLPLYAALSLSWRAVAGSGRVLSHYTLYYYIISFIVAFEREKPEY